MANQAPCDVLESTRCKGGFFFPEPWLYALDLLYGQLYSNHEWSEKYFFFYLWFNLKTALRFALAVCPGCPVRDLHKTTCYSILQFQPAAWRYTGRSHWTSVWFEMGLLSAFQRCNLSSPMALKASVLLSDEEIYSSPLRCGSNAGRWGREMVKGCRFHNSFSLWPNCVKSFFFGFPLAFFFMPVCHN